MSLQTMAMEFIINVLSVEIEGRLAYNINYQILRRYNRTRTHIDSRRYFIGRSNDRINRLKKMAKKVLNQTNRQIWIGDPDEHKPKVTYDSLIKFNQYIVGNENFMLREIGCTYKCSTFPTGFNHKEYEDTFYFSVHHPAYASSSPLCLGKVHECIETLDSVETIYESKMDTLYYANLLNEERQLYDILNSNQVRLYGRGDNSIKHESIKLRKGGVYCYNVLLRCDYPDSRFTERYFYLTSILSNTNNNKVISGIRFLKRNRIIYANIQQSTLLPNGLLNTSSSEWLPLPNFDSTKVFRIDYSTQIELNEIILPDRDITRKQLSTALTGFRLMKKNNIITFEAQFSKFNTTTGYIVQVEDEWMSTNCKTCKTFHQMHKDVPTDHTNHTLENSGTGRYLLFRQAGVKNDLGQSTIPFFDIQKVESKYGLAGIGMGIRKTADDKSGGFIQFILSSINFANYIVLDENKTE